MTIPLPMATRDLMWAVTRNDAARPATEREAILTDPGFGKNFTDHMVDICWSERGGWHRPRVQPYGPIPLDPAAAVLHYGQEIFEGLKAYRHADGSIWSFRPDANARRLQRSAARLALPELPSEYFIESLRQLVAVDGDWVPSAPETSLYLRPFMFAKEAFLGVRPANKVNYYVIASPAGAYFTGGVKPVSIWLSTDYARAGKGGTGAAKTGGNYASSLVAQAEATEHGCAQVLFLDSEEGKWIEELGGMNIVLVYKDGSLVTPYSDSILEGITRDSLLQLAEDRGHTVERRRVSIDEWREGAASGEIVEAFACGTAAVVTPIGMIKAKDFEIGTPDAGAGELTMSLREELTDIQYGRRATRTGGCFDWMREPDFARMTLIGRVGVVALCLGGGAALGFVGTFAHQSAPPIGVAIALMTVALFVVGLRAWGGVRAPAAAASIGVALVAGLLATGGGSSVLVPANTIGYAWLGGLTAIVFFTLAWPHVQRSPHRAPDTMESNLTEVPLGMDQPTS